MATTTLRIADSNTMPEPEQEELIRAIPDYAPAVAIEGADGVGAPAFGQVSRLFRRGAALYATLLHVPDEVAHAIRNGHVKKVTAEVYHNLTRGGQKFRRALKRVVLRGIPAPVVNLVPSGTVELSYSSFDSVHSYTSDVDPGSQVDARVREYMEAHPEATYLQGMDAVRDADPTLWTQYAGSLQGIAERNVGLAPRDGAGAEQDRYGAGMQIARLMRAEIDRNSLLGWSDALAIVLRKNPKLAEAYASGHGNSGFGTTTVDALLGE